MSKIQRSSYSQLDLLSQFDNLARRDHKLVNELKNAINNIRYFRINASFSEAQNKKELDEVFGQILYWLAFLAWKKARFIEEYKGSQLETFLKLTRNSQDLSVREIISTDTLSQYYLNAHKRFKTTCMAYKDILTDERGIVKRILDNFDKLHTLS